MLPNINGNVHHSPRRSPRRASIFVTLDDGRKIATPKNFIDELAVSTRGSSYSCPYSHVISVDAGFGCVELVVAGAGKVSVLSHIFKMRIPFFPKKHLEDAMKDAPGGKRLTIESANYGIVILATAYNIIQERFCSSVHLRELVQQLIVNHPQRSGQISMITCKTDMFFAWYYVLVTFLCRTKLIAITTCVSTSSRC